MNDLKKKLVRFLRNNSRASLSDFSNKNNIPQKKAHYEFSCVKQDIDKFVSVLDFEALGFVRLIVLFHDARDGFFVCSSPFGSSINNSSRLDFGLLVECVFFCSDDLNSFLSFLKSKNFIFDYFFVDKLLKQEGFVL